MSLSLLVRLVTYSDKTIELILDEIDKFSALFESINKPQNCFYYDYFIHFQC